MDRGGAAARNREIAARRPKRLAQDFPAGSAATEFRREPLLETAVVEAARRRKEDRVARGEPEVARPAVRGPVPTLARRVTSLRRTFQGRSASLDGNDACFTHAAGRRVSSMSFGLLIIRLGQFVDA